MLDTRITHVRVGEADARTFLESYIFGGKFGLKRVPRGIEPAFVSEFVRESISPTTEAGPLRRLLEVLRFYERSDVVPHLMAPLDLPLQGVPDLLRVNRVAQIAGELGEAAEAEAAAEHFDRVLVPHPAAANILPLLLETPLGLVPAGSYDAVAARIGEELARAQARERQDLESLYAYDKLAALARNDLVTWRLHASEKLRLLAAPPPSRRRELVSIYLGLAPAASEPMMIWAGRLLRREALSEGDSAVVRELNRALSGLDRSALGDARHDFILVLAAQAVIYLGGTLAPERQREFNAIAASAAGFLWDDP